MGPQRSGTAVAGGHESLDQRVLPRKEVELISLAFDCSCTTLDEMGTRRHISAALDAGATGDEVLLVLKCGVGVAVHSCSLGAPILLEEMKAAGVKAAGGPKPAIPACDWSVEHGMGSVLRALSCLDRSVLCLRGQYLRRAYSRRGTGTRLEVQSR
jgi:alkylhydroperoxidase/carboxymuconolactone decarboxylase family protein YurZ